MKSRDGKGQREEKSRREKIREEKELSRTKITGARKGRTVAKHSVFPMLCGSGGSKSRLAKAAGAEPNWPDERLKSARRCGSKHISKSTCTKHTQGRTTFGSCDVEKSARRCGAKHISKSKCTKHTRSGPLLAVEMSKKCTPLWCEAHFEVKMFTKHTQGRDHFWKLRCRKSARHCGAKYMSKSKCDNTAPGPDHFWRFSVSFRVAGARDCAPCPKVSKT